MLVKDSETYDALNLFGTRIIRVSKNNLRRKKKLASKRLHDSLDYDLKVHKNSFSLSFEMEDYGKYVDIGVEGVGGTKADGTNWKKKRVTSSKFASTVFGSSFIGTGSKFKYHKKRPPISALNGWTIRKGIAPRDASGRFTKRRGLLFAISNAIFHTGIETTNFFTKPFVKEFKELPDDLLYAYGLDLDKLLEQTL